MPGTGLGERMRRKKKPTKRTRTTEIMRVTSISWTEARIVIVRFCEMMIWMDGGIEAWSSGKRARTRYTVAIVFAAGWRMRWSITDSLPFTVHVVMMLFWHTLPRAK